MCRHCAAASDVERSPRPSRTCRNIGASVDVEHSPKLSRTCRHFDASVDAAPFPFCAMPYNTGYGKDTAQHPGRDPPHQRPACPRCARSHHPRPKPRGGRPRPLCGEEEAAAVLSRGEGASPRALAHLGRFARRGSPARANAAGQTAPHRIRRGHRHRAYEALALLKRMPVLPQRCAHAQKLPARRAGLPTRRAQLVRPISAGHCPFTHAASNGARHR